MAITRKQRNALIKAFWATNQEWMKEFTPEDAADKGDYSQRAKDIYKALVRLSKSASYTAEQFGSFEALASAISGEDLPRVPTARTDTHSIPKSIWAAVPLLVINSHNYVIGRVALMFPRSRDYGVRTGVTTLDRGNSLGVEWNAIRPATLEELKAVEDKFYEYYISVGHIVLV